MPRRDWLKLYVPSLHFAVAPLGAVSVTSGQHTVSRTNAATSVHSSSPHPYGSPSATTRSRPPHARACENQEWTQLSCLESLHCQTFGMQVVSRERCVGPQGSALLRAVHLGVPEPTALQEAVTSATYWESPSMWGGGEEELEELRTIASLPDNSWWSRDFQGEAQYVVVPTESSISTSGRIGGLATWREEATKTFARRDMRKKPGKRVRGPWWSTPEPAGLHTSYGSGYGLPAVGLTYIEDDFGLRESLIAPIFADNSLRVREIRHAADWLHLVEEYPLNVSATRSATWFDYSGMESDWWIPDYVAVAAGYDVVHVHTLAYLEVAGLPLSALGGSTMLAGWNPDASFWLTGEGAPGRRERWVRDSESSFSWYSRSV